MSATTTPEAGADIAVDLYPFLRKYKDGRIERFASSTFVPASEAPARATAGVATRDVVIDPVTGVSARLFLSAATLATSRRRTLPLIVYFHGGCFCTGSAFSKMFHRYAESLAARAGALVVSVDYRLAPEHPIPAAYDDAWAAFRWAASLSDPWLACHADPTRVFLAGESAGANIAHNVASRAGSSPDAIDIEGLILLQPFFWGVERLPFETDRRHNDGRHMFSPEKVDTFWPFLTAGLAGNDDPRLNPPAEQVASLPCRRAFVSVASEDLARDRGRRYAAWLDFHGRWCREVTLVESEGEDHAFHLYRPRRAAAVALMDSVVQFVNEEPNSVAETTTLLHDATRRMCLAASVSSSGSDKKICVSPRLMVRNALVVRPGTASAPRSFGLGIGHSRSLASKLVRKEPYGAAVLARTVARVCL